MTRFLLQEVDPEDEKALAKFMNPNPQPRITLADIIMGKITEKQTEIQEQFSEADGDLFFISLLGGGVLVLLQDLRLRWKNVINGTMKHFSR